jgi:stringent starvation protein B
MRPFLVPAYYDWLSASGVKPHIVVDVHYPGVSVPSGYDDEGRIVLNIDAEDIRHLEIDQQWVIFQAVFEVDLIVVRIPMGSIIMMFAPETSWYADFSSDPEPVVSMQVQGSTKKHKQPLFKILSSDSSNSFVNREHE